jgi:16S rRNA (guanine527-N7)-methyltransferase
MDYLEFWTICSSNGIVLEKEQVESFKRYERELLYWNEKVNLVSRKDLAHLLERHILHSLTILKYIDIKSKARCLDVGTGGGFPGIPLVIARPDLRMLLIDSIGKKIKITDMLAKHTGARFVTSQQTRAEELYKDKGLKQSFDFVFSRSVAQISALLGWTNMLTKKDGCHVFLKGGDLNEEINNAKRYYPSFDFEIIPINLLGCPWYAEQDKKIVVCRKINIEQK